MSIDQNPPPPVPLDENDDGGTGSNLPDPDALGGHRPRNRGPARARHLAVHRPRHRLALRPLARPLSGRRGLLVLLVHVEPHDRGSPGLRHLGLRHRGLRPGHLAALAVPQPVRHDHRPQPLRRPHVVHLVVRRAAVLAPAQPDDPPLSPGRGDRARHDPDLPRRQEAHRRAARGVDGARVSPPARARGQQHGELPPRPLHGVVRRARALRRDRGQALALRRVVRAVPARQGRRDPDRAADGCLVRVAPPSPSRRDRRRRGRPLDDPRVQDDPIVQPRPRPAVRHAHSVRKAGQARDDPRRDRHDVPQARRLRRLHAQRATAVVRVATARTGRVPLPVLARESRWSASSSSPGTC